MTRIVLIHGYGIGIDASLFMRAKGEDCGFEGFRTLIAEKKAVAFRWDIPKRVGFVQALNPHTYYSVYSTEKIKSVSTELQEKLGDFFAKEKPHTVVCHSMGAHLLVDFIHHHNLPAYIKKIVFVQADISNEFQIVNSGVLSRLQNGTLQWINCYCPWDNTLISSMCINHYIPSGLWKVSNSYIKNMLVPLDASLNVHTSSIRGKRLLRIVLSD